MKLQLTLWRGGEADRNPWLAKMENVSTEVESTVQLQARGCFTLVLGYNNMVIIEPPTEVYGAIKAIPLF